MGKRAQHMRLLVLAALCGGTISAANPAMRDYETLRQDVARTAAVLKEEAATVSHPGQLSTPPRGLTQSATAATVPMPAARLEVMDLRIALVQLAQSAGANDQLAVIRAQSSEQPRAVAIREGTVGLTDFLEGLSGLEKGFTGQNGLTVPVVIWPDARLEIGKGEQLNLDRHAGAFVANFGVLKIEGGAVVVTGDVNPNVPDFAPFVATAGAGHVEINDALLQGLGFGGVSTFSGLSVINGGLYPPQASSRVVNSVLRDVVSITLKGAPKPELLGNLFADARGPAIVIRNAPNSRVEGNLFTGGQGNAIRLTNASTGGIVRNNTILNGSKSGIFVENFSDATQISDNLIWGRDGAGISVNRADCVILQRNTTMENAEKGISLRRARAAQILDNRVFGNGSAGVFVADQPPGTLTTIAGNLFVGNRSGLTSAAADTLVLNHNDFSAQFPRFLDGDLNAQAPLLIRNLLGEQELILTAGGAEGVSLPPLSCTAGKES